MKVELESDNAIKSMTWVLGWILFSFALVTIAVLLYNYMVPRQPQLKLPYDKQAYLEITINTNRMGPDSFLFKVSKNGALQHGHNTYEEMLTCTTCMPMITNVSKIQFQQLLK